MGRIAFFASSTHKSVSTIHFFIQIKEKKLLLLKILKANKVFSNSEKIQRAKILTYKRSILSLDSAFKIT